MFIDSGGPRPFPRKYLSSFALGIFLIALVLRLIPVVLTRQLGIGLDDMFQYDMLARSLALGNGFRWYAPADLARLAPYLHVDITTLHLDPRGVLTTFRGLLYPAFLSLVYSLNGINDGRFFAARLAQAALGALLAPLTYFVGRHFSIFASTETKEPQGEGLRSSEKPARLAAWIVALYPTLLMFPLALASEDLFFPLVLGSVLALLQLNRARGPRSLAIHSVLAGLLLGLAALTRSVILPFAALAVLWVWLSLRQPRAAVSALLALAATIAPWIVRNSIVSGGLTGIETSMGYNLYLGYYPGSTGTFQYGPSLDLLSVLNDRQRDEIGTQKAMDFIRQDPARFPYLAVRRLGYFFNLELRGFTYFYDNDMLGYFPPPLMIGTFSLLILPFVVVSLSAVAGAALLPRGPQSLLLLLLFLGYLLPHVFILSEERFHLVLIPFFAMLAGGFWTNGFAALRARGPLVLSLAFVGAVLLLLNWGLELKGDSYLIMQMLGPAGNTLYLPY